MPTPSQRMVARLRAHEPAGQTDPVRDRDRSYGLVLELLKKDCLEPGDWGYPLKAGQRCGVVVGTRPDDQPPIPTTCERVEPGQEHGCVGLVNRGDLGDAPGKVVPTEKIMVPYPNCVIGS